MAEKTDATDSGTGSDLTRLVADKAHKIVYAVIAVVVVLIAVMMFFSHQRNQAAAREEAAETEMFKAEIQLMSTPESDGIAAFAKLAKDFQGVPAGSRALVSQFALTYNTGDYVQAEAVAREFIENYPGHPFVQRAQMALGQSLLMQGKHGDAARIFGELSQRQDAEIVPGAKLALAQTLQLQAEAARDNEAEYNRLLTEAREEFNDIISRSQNTIPSQRGFWPQSVTLPADFALVVANDRLGGYVHPDPLEPVPAASGAAAQPVMATPPPAGAAAEDAAAGDAGDDGAGAVVEADADTAKTEGASGEENE